MNKTKTIGKSVVSSSEHTDPIGVAMNEFVEALDAHDEERLKKCLSKYVQTSDSDLDAEIATLFEAYSGPTESWKWSQGSSEVMKRDGNEGRDYVTLTAVLKSKGRNYYISIDYTKRDFNDLGREGICLVDFTTQEVQAAYRNERFDLTEYRGEYYWEGEDRYKVHVTTSHKDEYETQRICGYETIYYPAEAEFYAMDYVKDVKKNNSLNSLLEKYGKPNAGSPEVCMYYKVKDSDDFYICVYLRGAKEKKVMQVDLVDEDRSVETLYSDLK